MRRLFTISPARSIGFEDQLLDFQNTIDQSNLIFEWNNRDFDWEYLSSKIISRKLSCGIIPLKDIPIKKPPEIKIVALLPRREVQNKLIVGNERDVCNVLHPLYCDLVISIRPEWKCAVETLERVQNATRNILPHYIQENGSILDSKSLSFEEFVPQVSEGILALVSHSEDSETHELFRKFHHRKTGIASNIERKILKQTELSNETILAHCHKDSQAKWHLSVKWQHKGGINSFHSSQTTYLGLYDTFAKAYNKSIT